MTELLHRNYEMLQFTINVRKPQSLHQCALQLVCEDRMFFVRLAFHFSLCGQQHPKCERAIRLVYPPSFCELRSTSKPTNRNVKMLGLENQRVLSG